MATLAASAIAPAAASAVTVQVAGDNGAPVTLGGPVNIRNMNTQILVTPTAAEHYAYSVTGPTGTPVTATNPCVAAGDPARYIDYVGNGVYTVHLAQYSTTACTGTPVAQSAVAFSITASVGLAAPAQPFLTRQPGKFATTTVPVGVNLNPGALSNDVFVGVNVAPNADGSLPGTPEQLFPDAATGTVGVPLDKGPGVYVVAARAKGYTGTYNPQAFSPWAPPVAIRAFGPFDLKSLAWTDSRGPSYRLRAVINERSATGKVKIQIGRGSKGRYRSVGSAPIRNHTFSKRFRLHGAGTYRVRFSYKGNATVAGGWEVRKFRVTRRIFFRSATAASATASAPTTAPARGSDLG